MSAGTAVSQEAACWPDWESSRARRASAEVVGTSTRCMKLPTMWPVTGPSIPRLVAGSLPCNQSLSLASVRAHLFILFLFSHFVCIFVVVMSVDAAIGAQRQQPRT